MNDQPHPLVGRQHGRERGYDYEGEPPTVPILESSVQRPINPYGWSKLFSERMLLDFAATNPQFSFAAAIIESAWRWFEKHPNGYER